MRQFVLYGTMGCHLCEEAEALLAPLLNDYSCETEPCEIECIDISEDDELMMRYAESIPVLRRVSDGAELNWPIDAARARDFLSI